MNSAFMTLYWQSQSVGAMIVVQDHRQAGDSTSFQVTDHVLIMFIMFIIVFKAMSSRVSLTLKTKQNLFLVVNPTKISLITCPYHTIVITYAAKFMNHRNRRFLYSGASSTPFLSYQLPKQPKSET